MRMVSNEGIWVAHQQHLLQLINLFIKNLDVWFGQAFTRFW